MQIAQDKAYLSKYFCISQIKGTYTSSNGKEEINIINTNGKSLFTWNKSGDYEIEVTYRVSDNIIDDLKTTYRFKIIPAHTVREAFSMTVSNDVQLVAVKRNGYKIHDFDNLGTDKVMSFSADYNPGSYVVTLKTYSEILQQYVTHDVQFNIGHKANSASNYFILSSGSGSATTGAVTLYYNPYWLYHSQGTVTIYLYKNFVEQEKVVVDMSTLNDNNLNSRELFTVSDAGSYSVVVRDVDGDPVYMDNWKIKAEESTFGYIILAVVLGVAGISILVFLRLRNKMTTK